MNTDASETMAYSLAAAIAEYERKQEDADEG